MNFLIAYWHTFFDNGFTGHEISIYAVVIYGAAAIVGVLTMIFAIISALEGDWPDSKEWDTGLRWGTAGLAVLSVWPFLLLLAAPCVALAGLFFVGRAWFRLVPSKEDRIAKAERKLDDARGKVADLRSN